MRGAPLVALLTALAGCAAPAPAPSSPFVGAVGAPGRIEGEAPVAAAELHRGRGVSIHRVEVARAVRPHRHERHEETVVMLAGQGVFTLDGEEHRIGPGAVMHIPRGAVHAYRHEGEGTTQVVSIFTPAFDGEDRVFEAER